MAAQTTMKALHYEGPFKVAVKEVPLPKIEHPDDVIIKVTTAGETALLLFYFPRVKPHVHDSPLIRLLQQSAAQTCTCTKAGPQPKAASSSATKTWASSNRSATA